MLTTHEFLKKIETELSLSAALRARGSLLSESEQIACACLRRLHGREVSRVELYSQSSVEGDIEWALSTARRRAQGEPLQYLLGVQYFYSHEYLVRKGVLIPRPETEILVDTIIKRIQSLGSLNCEYLGFEFGVGSGAISLELQSHFSELKMVGCEISSVAREVARENALQILGQQASRFHILSGALENPMQPFQEWVLSKGRKADFLVSNPPYLLRSMSEADLDVAQHEPEDALYARTDDGLDFYRAFIESAHEILTKEGWIAVEIASERAKETQTLFENAGWSVSLHDDLTGRSRVLMANQQSEG